MTAVNKENAHNKTIIRFLSIENKICSENKNRLKMVQQWSISRSGRSGVLCWRYNNLNRSDIDYLLNLVQKDYDCLKSFNKFLYSNLGYILLGWECLFQVSKLLKQN